MSFFDRLLRRYLEREDICHGPCWPFVLFIVGLLVVACVGSHYGYRTGMHKTEGGCGGRTANRENRQDGTAAPHRRIVRKYELQKKVSALKKDLQEKNQRSQAPSPLPSETVDSAEALVSYAGSSTPAESGWYRKLPKRTRPRNYGAPISLSRPENSLRSASGFELPIESNMAEAPLASEDPGPPSSEERRNEEDEWKQRMDRMRRKAHSDGQDSGQRDRVR